MEVWKKELGQQARKYHILAATLLSIGFSIFVIADYFGRTWEVWLLLTFWRMVVVLLVIPLIWLTYKQKIHENILAYSYVLLMSSYIIWVNSITPVPLKSAIVTALIIFYIISSFAVLWHWTNNIICGVILVSLHLFSSLQAMSFSDFIIYNGLWAIMMPFTTAGITFFRYNFTKKEISMRLNLLEKNEEINQQKEELIAQNQQIEQHRQHLELAYTQITDSVQYAKRIQQALLPKNEHLRLIGQDSFLIYQAKDTISGDFFWINQSQDFQFLALADCTGHGVSGGFMTMIGHSLLNQIVQNDQFVDPAQILSQLDQRLLKLLRQQEESQEKIADGMDIILIRIDKKEQKICFSGAKRPLWLFSKHQFFEYKTDRFPIGDSFYKEKKFTTQHLTYQKNETLYLFSDGYADQFNEKNEKFLIKNFRKLMQEIHTKELVEQEQILKNKMLVWQKSEEQTDDWLIIGLKL